MNPVIVVIVNQHEINRRMIDGIRVGRYVIRSVLGFVIFCAQYFEDSFLSYLSQLSILS